MTIPVIDYNEYFSNRPAFVDKLANAFIDTGFCGIRNTGVEVMNASYKFVFPNFFDRPLEEKMRLHFPELAGQMGYTPFMSERAKGAAHPDLKEFCQVIDGKRYDSYRVDLMLSHHPIFPMMESFGTRSKRIGQIILSCLATYLEKEDTFFDWKIIGGESVVRAIHYPPIDAETESVRSGAHEDIDFLTILVSSSSEGLELLSHDKEWIPVNAPRDVIIVNIGDMLEMFTDGVFRSTTHRVVNPVGEKVKTSRFSMPYFLHPNPSLVLDGHTLTADQFLNMRLKEIGLRK